MKILILSNYGMGLYKFSKELMEELLLRQNEVHLSLPTDEYIDKLVRLGCGYTPANVDRRGTNPINDLRLLNHYLSLIKRIKPDLVLTFTIKPNIYGGIACQLMKTPYITNITGLGSAMEKEGFLQILTLRLYSLGLRRSHCVFFSE